MITNYSTVNVTDDEIYEDDHWRRRAYISAGIPILALAIGAIVLNGMILKRFCLHRCSLSVNMKMTFSLAAADLWASSLVAFSLVGNSLMPTVFGRDFEEIACLILALEATKLGAILTSVLHLLALAANQCFSIVDPIGHKVMVTSNVCKAIIVCLWLMPALGFLGYFELIADQGFRSYQCENLHPYQMQKFRAVVFCVIAVPMFLMVTVYVIIWCRLCKYKMKKSASSTNNLMSSSPSGQPCLGGGQYWRQMRAVIMTTLIVGTFVFSWLPSILLYLLVCANCAFQTHKLDEKLVFALSVTKTVLILVKLLLNPLIYSWRLRINLKRSTDCAVMTVVQRNTNCRNTSFPDSAVNGDGKRLLKHTLSHEL